MIWIFILDFWRAIHTSVYLHVSDVIFVQAYVFGMNLVVAIIPGMLRYVMYRKFALVNSQEIIFTLETLQETV